MGQNLSCSLYPMPPSPRDMTSESEYVDKLRDSLETCYSTAREHLKQAASRQKRDYDSRTNFREGLFGLWEKPVR